MLGFSGIILGIPSTKLIPQVNKMSGRLNAICTSMLSFVSVCCHLYQYAIVAMGRLGHYVRFNSGNGTPDVHGYYSENVSAFCFLLTENCPLAIQCHLCNI